MYHSDQALTGADDVARARLSREFPELSPQIVAAVADAYRRAAQLSPESGLGNRESVSTAG